MAAAAAVLLLPIVAGAHSPQERHWGRTGFAAERLVEGVAAAAEQLVEGVEVRLESSLSC